MADLDAASLADVKQWFIDKYGPNNAVLVLAGDINAAEARPLVEKYFGAITRGPVNTPAAADVPTLAAPKSIVMKDRVAAVQIQRHWAVPGPAVERSSPRSTSAARSSAASPARASTRSWCATRSSRSASAPASSRSSASACSRSTATVKPGVDPAVVDKRLDEIIADYHRQRPDRG